MEDREVQAAEAALHNGTVGDPSRANALNEVGKALQNRYLVTNRIGDLDRAICIYNEAIEISQSRPTDQARYLNNISVVFQHRYHRTGKEIDLDEAIKYAQRAVATASNQHRPAILMNFANSLQERFTCTGDMADLDQCVKTYKEALLLLSAAGVRPKLLSNLCAALTTRFSVKGLESDIDDACTAGQEAVALTDDEHPMRAIFLDTLGNAMYARFRQTMLRPDLDDAICSGEAAVTLAERLDLQQLPLFYVNLGGALGSRFKLSRSITDINQAIEMFEVGEREIPKEHPGYENCLANKGSALLMRFEGTGSENDLSGSIEACSEATSLKLLNEYTRAESENALANALLRKYDLEGSAGAIDTAVRTYKQALNRIPNTAPQAPVFRYNLSSALQARFELRGSMEDLNEALKAIEQDLPSVIESSPAYATSLFGIGNTLVRRFERTGARGDLDRAITAYEDAVERTMKEAQERAGRLTSLGHALQLRYELTKSDTDWNRSVRHCQEAVNASRDDPNNHLYLTNLGNAFLRRSIHNTSVNKLDDLARAIMNLVTADSEMPKDHSNRVMCLNNLGKAYELRFEHSQLADDFDRAVKAYEAAMNLNSASPMLRVTAGYRGAILTGEKDLTKAAYFVCETTRLLPIISPRILNRSDQQDNLATFSGLASHGAAILLEAEGDAFKALQTLELSRGVMTGLLLETRTDISALQQDHPELAERFKALRDQLDSPPVAFPKASESRIGSSLDVERRITASKEFQQLADHIRTYEKYERFLLEPSQLELQSLAEQGPLVVLNVSQLRSDALIVSREKTWHLPLRQLLQDDVLQKARTFLSALEEDTPVHRVETNDTLKQILEWIWDCAVCPVLANLGMTSNPLGRHRPRVWWIPVGLMSIFPIHAAGRDEGQLGENALDCVISSYSPTIKALEYSRQKQSRIPAKSRNLLFVAMQKTPNQKDLRFADKEVDSLVALAPESMTKTLLKRPTKDQVLPLLETCDIVHFSCHGVVDLNDPSASCLLLEDWEADPLTVADVATVTLQNSCLAYLSACHTANNKVLTLLDEGIHLTGAFQISGFPHTIGTTWQVEDERCLQVSRRVWQTMLTAEGDLDFSKAAEGLHVAMRKLREETKWIEEGGITMEFPDEPLIWAPFIHMGA